MSYLNSPYLYRSSTSLSKFVVLLYVKISWLISIKCIMLHGASSIELSVWPAEASSIYTLRLSWLNCCGSIFHSTNEFSIQKGFLDFYKAVSSFVSTMKTFMVLTVFAFHTHAATRSIIHENFDFGERCCIRPTPCRLWKMFCGRFSHAFELWPATSDPFPFLPSQDWKNAPGRPSGYGRKRKTMTLRKCFPCFNVRYNPWSEHVDIKWLTW